MEEEKKQQEELKMEKQSIISSKRKFEMESQLKETEIRELSQYKELVQILQEQKVIDINGEPIGKKFEPNFVENEEMQL